jgi:hypothetical protein
MNGNVREESDAVERVSDLSAAARRRFGFRLL